RELRFGVTERVGPAGEIITPLDEASLADAVQRIASHDSKVESAAVCLLFSFANPAHEQMLARALEPLGIPVSMSHKILPEYREYERTSTVVINAYLVPLMSRYLSALADGLRFVAGGQGSVVSKKVAPKSARKRQPMTGHLRLATALRVMQSNGGSVSA